MSQFQLIVLVCVGLAFMGAVGWLLGRLDPFGGNKPIDPIKKHMAAYEAKIRSEARLKAEQFAKEQDAELLSKLGMGPKSSDPPAKV